MAHIIIVRILVSRGREDEVKDRKKVEINESENEQRECEFIDRSTKIESVHVNVIIFGFFVALCANVSHLHNFE